MNKPELIQDIENKLNKEQVKNTLTEIEIGNALDASQGKVLNDKINVLSANFKTIGLNKETASITEVCAKIEEMKIQRFCDYTGNNTTTFPTAWTLLKIERVTENFMVCEISSTPTTGLNKKWFGYYRSTTGHWTGWQQVATTIDTKALDDKINALDDGAVKRMVSNYVPKGLTVNQWATYMSDSGGRAIFSNNLYRDTSDNYRFVNSHPYATGVCFTTNIFERKPKFVVANGSSCTADSVASITEYELATTEKMEILSSGVDNPKGLPQMANGWVSSFGVIGCSKSGNIVTISGLIKDGGATHGTLMLSGLPLGFRPLASRYCPIYCGGTYPYKTGMVKVGTDGSVTLDGLIENNRVIFTFSYNI